MSNGSVIKKIKVDSPFKSKLTFLGQDVIFHVTTNKDALLAVSLLFFTSNSPSEIGKKE